MNTVATVQCFTSVLLLAVPRLPNCLGVSEGQKETLGFRWDVGCGNLSPVFQSACNSVRLSSAPTRINENRKLCITMLNRRGEQLSKNEHNVIITRYTA